MGSSLMSFSFGSYEGYNEVPKEVWCLFADMAKNPTKSNPYVFEILQAGLKGRVNTGSDFFMDAYCHAITANTQLAESASRRKLLHCIDDSEAGDNSDMSKGGYGTMAMSQVSMMSRMEDSFEKILDSEELLFAIAQIKSIQVDFIINEGVDVVEVLKSAVKGIPSAVSKLRDLCTKFSDFAENVQVVLSSGEDVLECFA